MHSLFRRDYAFTAPCPYVPLTQYDWKSYNPDSPPGCGTLAWNPVVFSVMAAFQAGTFLTGLEVNVQLFLQFQRKSLYFWSIFIASWGAMIFEVAGFILQYVPGSAVYGSVILDIAWVAMVTGFSFVLYSRLHFLDPRPLLLRVILICIIVDALLFHVPVIITTILSNVNYTAATWKAYTITSYTEIAFTVQETAIATLYVYLFLVYTKDRRGEKETKTILWQLFVAEFVVFSTDILLNVLLYTENYLPRQIIQSFVSVLKLKIEFAVLNSLIKYSKSKSSQQMELNWAVQEETFASPTISVPMAQDRGMSKQPKYEPEIDELDEEARGDRSSSTVPDGASHHYKGFQFGSSSIVLQSLSSSSLI